MNDLILGWLVLIVLSLLYVVPGKAWRFLFRASLWGSLLLGMLFLLSGLGLSPLCWLLLLIFPFFSAVGCIIDRRSKA